MSGVLLIITRKKGNELSAISHHQIPTRIRSFSHTIAIMMSSILTHTEKVFFAKHGYFDLYWPPEPYLLELDHFCRRLSETTVQELSIVFFLLPPIYTSFWDNSRFMEKSDILPILAFDDLWWPCYWPGRKNDWSCLDWKCCRLSNTVYRIFLSLFVSKIEIGLKSPLPLQ